MKRILLIAKQRDQKGKVDRSKRYLQPAFTLTSFLPCRFRYPTAIKLLSTRLSSQYRSVNVKAVCETAWPLFNIARLDGHSPVCCLELTSSFHAQTLLGLLYGFQEILVPCVLTEADWHRNGNSGVIRPCASSREGISIPQRFHPTE